MNAPLKEKTTKCPTCPESALVMSDRLPGVEIDYCPDCRAVWHDRNRNTGRQKSWMSNVFD